MEVFSAAIRVQLPVETAETAQSQGLFLAAELRLTHITPVMPAVAAEQAAHPAAEEDIRAAGAAEVEPEHPNLFGILAAVAEAVGSAAVAVVQLTARTEPEAAVQVL